jgi:GNAT superfamily N-acetyltransferase
MSAPDADTALSPALLVRSAGPADHPAIRDVLIAAYGQYAGLMGSDIFPNYLADLLHLDRHACYGRLLVAETGGRVAGSAAFYPDASVQGVGFPAGWAGGRGLAVHPSARGSGVGRTLLAACERLARQAGAPVFAFHTATFMTGAISLYERLGYLRAPELDFDMAAHYGRRSGSAPIMSIAYVRHLTRARLHADGVRPGRCAAGSAA